MGDSRLNCEADYEVKGEADEPFLLQQQIYKFLKGNTPSNGLISHISQGWSF